MDRADKILNKMKQNPDGWRIQDIETVAKRYNLQVRKPTGSHVIIKQKGQYDKVSIPAKRPIKTIYIKQFIKLIEKLEGKL